MKFEIKSEENVPSAEIRRLSDAETEGVEGGAYRPPPPGGCFPRRDDKEFVML